MNKNALARLFVFSGLAIGFLMAGCAPVTVTSLPQGANVYLKGSDRLVGQAPVTVNLFAADKDVIVRKHGYFSKTVHLSPLDPESVLVVLEPRENVLLLSNPERAEVFVKGEKTALGFTPYEIDYGKPYRTFELRAGGYESETVTVPEEPEDNITVELERKPYITIESRPKRVNIFNAEGAPLGMTPVKVTVLEEMELEARKDGYYSKKFNVDSASEGDFIVELEREPVILIYSEPEDAIVYQRGVVVGRTPYRKLVEKETEFELKLDRHYPKTIYVDSDSPRQIQVKLEEKPYIIVDSEPSGADLYRAGGVELIGATPAELLIEEVTALELQLRDYDTKTFSLSPNSQRNVTVPLQKATGKGSAVATVVVDSFPSGAQVYRPGGAERLGVTPLEQRIGAEKTLELQLEGYKNKIVTIAPDSPERVVFELDKDGAAGDVIIRDPLLNTPASF